MHPIPLGTEATLGLGDKFCIRRARPTNNYSATLARLKRDVRIKYQFRNSKKKSSYIPGLYIPNEMWTPKKASKQVEAALTKFESKIHHKQQQYQRCSHPPNITQLQANVLVTLHNNKVFIVIPSDKNLGFVIMEREEYIKSVLEEHLLDSSTYKQLNDRQFRSKQVQLEFKFYAYIQKYFPTSEDDDPPDPVAVFLRRCHARDRNNIAQFRATIKVHKTPWKTRPVVAKVGTYIEGISKWCDKQLFRLTPHIPTIVRDSQQLRDRIVELALQPNARMFTADAFSMYQKIDIDHGLQVMRDFFNYLSQRDLLPEDFPTDAVLEGLELVMRFNLFQFGDANFIQLIGTAMGTSVAVVYANLYAGWHEITSILPRFQDQLKRLPYLFRFVDDLWGIWIGPTDHEWQEFKDTLSNHGLLKWDVSEPSYTVDYLDLTIILKNGRITTKTYQKAMNLYLYIPPHSAHPPGMIKGMVYGLLRRYYEQNSEREDFLHIMSLLYKRLIWRGWDQEFLKELFLSSYERVKSKAPSRAELAANLGPVEQEDSSRKRLFFHLEYHPCDLPRRQIRQLYDQVCKDTFETDVGITEFTVAYKRPTNIYDSVVRTKLYEVEGKSVSYYIGEANGN